MWNKLIAMCDRYFQTMNWKKFSALKICCIAFGVALGAFLPEKYRKVTLSVASGVFALTYVPIMADFVKQGKIIDEELYYI